MEYKTDASLRVKVIPQCKSKWIFSAVLRFVFSPTVWYAELQHWGQVQQLPGTHPSGRVASSLFSSAVVLVRGTTEVSSRAESLPHTWERKACMERHYSAPALPDRPPTQPPVWSKNSLTWCPFYWCEHGRCDVHGSCTTVDAVEGTTSGE